VESEPDKGATFYIDLPLKNISTEKKELDFKAV
jgi:signal transduction histidine kinase